eukprot:jgi/Pico_ML_1/52251/g2983.t2
MAEDVARLARASSSMADVPSDAIASGSEERSQRTKRKHAFVDDVDVASEEDDPSVEEDDAHAATDEEDEEEEEEEERTRGERKETQRYKRSRFIDDIADVGDDEDEDEDEGWDEEGQLMDDEGDLPDEGQIRKMHARMESRARQKEQTDEELERFIEERMEKQLAPGSWARVKSGTYKSDLVQVVDVREQDNVATVKIIPRIDFALLAAKIEGRAEKGKASVRPPARMFSASEARTHGLALDRTMRDPYTGEPFEVFRGQRFRDGFMYKEVSLRSLKVDGVVPTLEELEKFQLSTQRTDRNGNGPTSDLASLAAALPEEGESKLTDFTKGDVVVVREGDLKHLKGKVIRRTEDSQVEIMPMHEDLKEPLTFAPAQIQKFFSVGDHVKVMGGRHAGETGLIVKVNEGPGVASIFSDSSREEMQCFVRDLAICVEVSDGALTFGPYELHDLVALDATTVGVIVRVERERCHVLTNQGRVDKPDVRLSHVTRP